MSNIFITIMSMLAIWRAVRMLQDEEGPFAIFSRLQAWVYSQPDVIGGVYRAFTCFYCLSMWIAIPFAIYLTSNFANFIIYWLGLSAGAIIIDALYGTEEE